jgi:hypothetical protein
VAVDDLTIQQALFWMNLYRELLAADESALLRMRALMAAEPADGRGELYYMPDVELVMGEIERVRTRLDFWLRHVDQLK